MKLRAAILSGFVLLFGTMAFAQENPKVEVSVDYSYIHANPQNNDIIKPFSLNGGGGAAAFYFNKYIGIEAEFQGYGSFTHSLVIPAGSAACPGATNCLTRSWQLNCQPNRVQGLFSGSLLFAHNRVFRCIGKAS